MAGRVDKGSLGMAVPVMPSVMVTADVPLQPFQTYLSFLPSPHVVNSPYMAPQRNSAQLEQKKNIWK